MIQELGVVVPVYNTPDRNRTGLFRDTVASALAQDYDYTLLIVDNGSTDEATLDFYETLDDSRVRIEKIGRVLGQRGTPSVSLNFGFNWLYDNSADAFCYLHSDDLLLEDSLEKRVGELAEGNDMVYGRAVLMLNNKLFLNKYPERDFTNPQVLSSGFPNHTSMWSRDMMGRMLEGRQELFNLSMKANEDADVTLYSRRLLVEGNLGLGFLDEPVYVWRDHEGNISNAIGGLESTRQTRFAYRNNGLDYPSHLTLKGCLKRPGFWLPRTVKSRLNPLKNKIRRLSGGRLYEKSYHEELDIDPYWFKEEVNV